MKKEELDNWIKTAKYIESIELYTDACGNYEVSKIFKKNEKLYKIDFQNDYPYGKYIDGNGYIKGEYSDPIEVQKKTRIIEETYYETPDEYQYNSSKSILQPE